MIRELSAAALVLMSVVALGCAASDSEVGGSGAGNGGAGGAGAGIGTDGGSASGTGGGGVDNCIDADHDGVTTCAGDCDDNDATVFPGATETLNQKDDDCSGVIDDHIVGRDFDNDGTPYPQDCNDNEPLVGPLAIEDPTNH